MTPEVIADKRAKLLRDTWTGEARYVDPLMSADGLQQIDGLIEGVHQRFVGFRFALLGQPDGRGDHVRVSWSLGPSGAEPPPGPALRS